MEFVGEVFLKCNVKEVIERWLKTHTHCGNGHALSAQLPNDPVEINRVPVHYGGGDQTEA
jgi:hypothetical protein